MGEIRKDNLHESLIEELNELANRDLSGKQDKTDESLLTESKDVIGAINELFQSANNGKELIANAIGEPLNSEDTFSAMSNNINGLLSQFKTNMMNNGVTVEASDKFQSLINKIATMTEEGNSKGIQFASGSIETSELIRKTYASLKDDLGSGGTGEWLCFDTSALGFIPSIVLINFLSDNASTINDAIYDTLLKKEYYIRSYAKKTGYSKAYSGMKFPAVMDNYPAILPIWDTDYLNYPVSNIQYIAIGVGEEDTTLRDSLASILQEEGVNVTEEDDMASLISKVDEEFDRKNNEMENNRGLDIISATELPATGKENQLCIITNNPVDDILVTPFLSNTIPNNNIIVYTNNDTPNYSINFNNTILELSILKVWQTVNTNLKTYKWNNNSWELLYKDTQSLVTNGQQPSDIDGFFKLDDDQWYYSSSNSAIAPYRTQSNLFTCFTKSINFTLYNKVDITCWVASTTNGGRKLYFGSSTTLREISVNSDINTLLNYNSGYVYTTVDSKTKKTFTLDITDINGWGYPTLIAAGQINYLYITNIRLY